MLAVPARPSIRSRQTVTESFLQGRWPYQNREGSFSAECVLHPPDERPFNLN
jgi:hypothetical protein